MGNLMQRENRCWGLHISEGCFCLPWKKSCPLKTRQDAPKQSEGMASSSSKDNANQTYPEELCYILINHRASGKLSGNSAEEEATGELYENISCRVGRPNEPVGRGETQYSLLHAPSTRRHPETEYAALPRVPATLKYPPSAETGYSVLSVPSTLRHPPSTETEYSPPRVPATLKPAPPPEDEYELLLPSTVPSHSLQLRRPPTAPFETQFSHSQ